MRRSPLGNPVLWVVAAFVIPELVKKCKPLAKVVGNALTSAGEAFHKAAEEPAKAEVVVAEEPTSEEHHADEPVADEHAEPTHAKKSKSKGAEAAE